MTIQDYNLYTKNAFNGQVAYASEPRTIVSGSLEDAVAEFGSALKMGAVAGGVALGHSAGNVFGVALRELNHEAFTRPSDGTTKYKSTESVSVLRQGTVNLLLTGAAASVAGTVLNVVDASGVFTADAVAAGITASVNVVALETAIAGSIIKARIDIVA